MAVERQQQKLSSLSVRMIIYLQTRSILTAMFVDRVGIDLEAIHRFTMNISKEEEKPLQPVLNEPIPKSRRKIMYNRISKCW